MRYTHSFRSIHKRKHILRASLIITGLIISLVAILGFTVLDAKAFFLGFFESLTRVTVAYFIALILALLLALFTIAFKSIEETTLSILDVLQSFPSFALFPLLIIWFGKTSSVTIIILVIAMIWPILFSLISGQKQIREDLLEAAKVFGARGPKYFTYVLIPLLLPSIVTGSIVAWGEAWETLIAAEIIVSVPGVGTYLAGSGADFNSTVLVIGILLLLMMLFILNKYIWLPLLYFSTRYQN